MKKIKNYLESLNLSFKKEILLFIICNLLCIAIVLVVSIISKNYLFFIVGILLTIGINISLIMRYSYIKSNIIKNHENEFVYFIQYLEIFLSNKYNVYSSFLAVKEYMSDWMQNRIDELINDIDKDKSINPYINFAKNFKAPVVSNVMMNIYQMVNEGEDEMRLQQFDLLFVKYFENYQEIRIDKRKKNLDNLSIYPLIGAGIITIILILGVVIIMEDMINVL